MAKKSKRNSGPRPGSNRAERLAERRAQASAEPTARPFAGLAAECDLVAMREFVPSATATVEIGAPRPVTLATVLPGAVAAFVRDEQVGEVAVAPDAFVALQVQMVSRDIGAGLAAAIEWATAAKPGASLTAAEPTADTRALVDVLGAETELDITVHRDFDWWVPSGVEPTAEVAAAITRANEAMMPSHRITADGVVAAWWVDAGERAHLRWVRPEDEDDLMLALARLHAAGGLHLGEGSRFAGSFRTHGLLVPVFDLDNERHAQEWAAPTAELGERLAEALAVDAPLTVGERRARDGLRGRQVTLR